MRPMIPVCIALALSGGFVGSCARSPAAPDPRQVFLPIQADFPEAWSHDGRLIAFRRVYASNYGPPGIYLISPAGGQPRWLCAATLFWPARLRFAPDDRTLLAINNLNLQLIDVQTGAVQQPMATNSAVTGGEWLRDGHQILYFRSSYDPEAPADSSWMHVLDLEADSDRPFTIDGRNLSLESMHAGPDGRVAAIEHLPTSDRLVTIDIPSAHSAIIYDTHTLRQYRNVQWWIRPSVGRGDLIFEMTNYVGWSITPGASSPVRFAPGWNPFRLMSPTGEMMVTDGTDPATRVGILDLASVDDISGASHQHLTSFRPPAGALQTHGFNVVP